MGNLKEKFSSTENQLLQLSDLKCNSQKNTFSEINRMPIEAFKLFNSPLIMLAERDAVIFEQYLNQETFFSQTRQTRLARKKGLKILKKAIKDSKLSFTDTPLIGVYEWLPDFIEKSAFWDRWYAPLLQVTQQTIKQESIKLTKVSLVDLYNENKILKIANKNFKNEIQMIVNQNTQIRKQNESIRQQNDRLEKISSELRSLLDVLLSNSVDPRLQNAKKMIEEVKIENSKEALPEYKKSTQSTRHTTLFAPLPVESETVVSKSITTQSTAVNIKYEKIDVEVSQNKTTTKDTTFKAP